MCGWKQCSTSISIIIIVVEQYYWQMCTGFFNTIRILVGKMERKKQQQQQKFDVNVIIAVWCLSGCVIVCVRSFVVTSIERVFTAFCVVASGFCFVLFEFLTAENRFQRERLSFSGVNLFDWKPLSGGRSSLLTPKGSRWAQRDVK